jgi:hypothetical protein
MIIRIVPATPAWLFLYYNYIIVIPSAIIRRGVNNGSCFGMAVVVGVVVAVVNVIVVVMTHAAVYFAAS